MLRPVVLILSVISAASAFAVAPLDTSNQVIISVRDQKLVLMRDWATPEPWWRGWSRTSLAVSRSSRA